MKRLFFCIFLVALTACSAAPSEGAIHTAIAQTQEANPTATIIPPTITPTITPTETPTETPTRTPSPTPDLRIIEIDPQKFLLTKEDLPLDAKYYLPNATWISPHHNEEILGGWGVEKGRAYLAETGRIDGWWVAYKRGGDTVIAPEEIYDNVIMYKTAEGAQIVITKYEDSRVTKEGYTEIKNPPNIGDQTRAFIKKTMQSSGENRVTYMIAFSYRNYVHIVEGWGWEHEVKPEYVENIARILLQKLQEAPLSSP